MTESVLSLIDRLVARPGQADLLEQLEHRAAAAGPEDLALVRRYVEFESRRPTTFTLETVLSCNLRCPECAIGGGMTTRKRKILSLDEFDLMFGKVKEWARYTYLHLWGEPFLNRDILEMTRTASRTSRVNLSTNALLIRREQVEPIVASGVGDMIVSIDGATQEVYEKYRVGGKVEDAFRALGWLAEENRRQGSPVSITPQFIVFEHNRHEIETFRARCEGLGLRPVFKAPYLRGHASRFRASSLPEYQRRTWDDLPSLRQAISGCTNPPDVLTVDVQGKVILCCHDYDGQESFGNLLESSFEEIWNHPRYRQARWNIQTGRPPRFCETGCMTYFLTSEYPVEGKAPPVAPTQEAGNPEPLRINLCGGSIRLPGWIGVDVDPAAQMRLDLERDPLPWQDGTVDAIACISAINYFTPARALEILRECLRVLRPGGVLRLGTQDLRVLARRYVERDTGFFLEKLPDGRDRYPGETLADKLCNWFYGFEANGHPCRYVYDDESLARLVGKAGFVAVRECRYREGDLPDVALLDNRPEQMFFLEARKAPAPDIRTGRDAFAQGMGLWKEGKRSEGWQLLLEDIRRTDCPAAKVEAFLPLVEECSNEEETVKILRHLSTLVAPGRLDGRLRQALEREALRNRLDVLDVAKVPFAALGAPDPVPLRGHLDAALSWLVRSDSPTGLQGSSSYYDYRIGKWGAAYPETTGYIVATLLRAAQALDRDDLVPVARRMGDWLCSIQERDGGLGEAVGSFATHPRVFNSGQAMLGWIALHKAGLGDRYLDAARRCGDWLCGIQDADGKWSRSTYAGPKPYHSRVAWAQLELFALTSDPRHLESSHRHLQWTMAQALPEGTFRGNSLSEPDRPWTHLIGYVLFGVVEQLRLRKLLGIPTEEAVLDTLRRAGDRIAACHREANERGLPSLSATYDLDWKSGDDWSCVTGNSQIAHFLTKLSHRTDDEGYARLGRRILSQTAALQFLDPSLPPDMLGGLPGSFPHQGPYLRHRIPNWGVKFFADAILEIEAPTSTSSLIG